MKRTLSILVIVLYSISCSDSEENPNENIALEEPAITEIGWPLEDAVTKEIGSAGGTLTSEDNGLDIIVPPGAVSQPTTFSVQAIENFCPGGLAAYELLPEGQTFSLPVILVFHFTEDEFAGLLPDFLNIAYQGKDRIWYALADVTVDTEKKTISAPVKHFTPYARVSDINIQPQRPPIINLDVGESTILWASSSASPVSGPITPPAPGEDDLTPLPSPKDLIGTWYVNGVLNGNDNVGIITPIDEFHVSYTAPNTVPANNPVTVNVDVEGMFMEKKKVFNKVSAFKRIKINPDEYQFTLKIEANVGSACSHNGQTEHDTDIMDVFVSSGEVTVTNFVNRDGIISGGIVNHNACEIECTLPGGGVLNATKGAGEITDDAFRSIKRLNLTITHDATSPRMSMDCGNGPPVINESQHFVNTEHFSFDLRDDIVQTDAHGQGSEYYKATLTPK